MKNSHLLAAAKLQTNHLLKQKDDQYHHYTIQNASKSQNQDFTDLWNQISDDDEQPKSERPIPPQQQQCERKFNHSNQIIPIETEKKKSVSSFDQQQMAEWLQQCQDSDKQDIPNSNNSLEKYCKQIQPQKNQRSESQSEVSGLDELWDMIQDSDKQQAHPNTVLMECQKITNNRLSDQKQNKEKVSEENCLSINTIKERCNIEAFNKKETKKMMPPIYSQFNGCETLYIQEVEAEIKGQQNGSSEIFQLEDKLTKNCQLIVQQIEQESKEENNYRNYTSQILIYGTDFYVFDLAYFAKNSLKPSTHMYFGLKSILGQNRIKNQYLYFPNTGQCVLKTKYNRQSDRNKENSHKNLQLNIHLALNDEKVATAQKTVFESNKEKREVYEVKNYDSFTRDSGEYLGIIETKAGKIFESWFCDTIIYIPKKKIFSKNINNHDWEKLKISLKTKNGMILAELGIEVADNSVINCVLFNEQKCRQFMMGMMKQQAMQTDYILRVGGISPIIGLMTGISRREFAYSSN